MSTGLKAAPSYPMGAFLLTFDDGFLGVYEHAYPLLLELGWPATVFLVSALIGKQDEWTKTENPSGACYPLLDRDHIEEMRENGFSFHSHTRHHKDLTSLAEDALDDQLVGSKRELESILGCKVRYLAYPYGLIDARAHEATRAAGYKCAFSVQPGFNRQGNTDMFHIRRLDVFGTDSAAALARKVRFGSNDGSLKTAIALLRIASRREARRRMTDQVLVSVAVVAPMRPQHRCMSAPISRARASHSFDRRMTIRSQPQHSGDAA